MLILPNSCFLNFFLCGTSPLHKDNRRSFYNFYSIKPLFILGCDKKSKIRTKSAALKVASTEIFDELVSFGQSIMDEETLTLAENFLFWRFFKDKNVKMLNQLRNIVYYEKSKELDLEKLPATSSCVLLNIKRKYLQTYLVTLGIFGRYWN